jgi:hypothetical protein
MNEKRVYMDGYGSNKKLGVVVNCVVSKFDSKALEGTFVGYAVDSHAFRVFDKESARVVKVSNVRFDENDGSRVEQSGVCDVGDEIPPRSIRRMGVGHLIPIEEHLLAEGEGLCSTQVDPSPSQAQQAPQGPIDANQRQSLDHHPSEQGQDQDQVDGGEPSPMVDQGQAQDDEHVQYDEQAQVEGQGEDQNSGDDKGVSQESFEEAQARHARKVEEALHKGSHTMDSVIGSVRRGVSIRRQLANFSSHHAYISCVEPQKVFEALEDPDWVEAMHEELNNFESNKVWSLVEKPKDCCNVIGTKRVFKNKQDATGNGDGTGGKWLVAIHSSQTGQDEAPAES